MRWKNGDADTVQVVAMCRVRDGHQAPAVGVIEVHPERLAEVLRGGHDSLGLDGRDSRASCRRYGFRPSRLTPPLNVDRIDRPGILVEPPGHPPGVGVGHPSPRFTFGGAFGECR